MLPGGVLAKHGYTTKWGFFSGVCSGAACRPYETHTDLIERFIANAQQRKDMNEAFIAKLLAPPTEAKGWVHAYRSGNWQEKSGYYWREVEFTMLQGKYDGKPRAKYANPFKEGEWLDCYQHSINIDWQADQDNILNYVAAANAKKAQAVAKENEEIQRYIDWQRRRIAEWKEQPLQPR